MYDKVFWDPEKWRRNIMKLSAHSIQGKRGHMEDYFDIAYQLKSDDKADGCWPFEYIYFGVFDGHGGAEASKFARENLVKFITKEKDFWSDKDEDVLRAIRRGFSEVQNAMRKEMTSWETDRLLPSTAGTTASVLFIRNGKYYIGHVGDSRIVISRENKESKMWIAHQITEDHKPDLSSELERIERAGGEVRDKLGVQRVVWKKPMVRKLGSLPANQPENPKVPEVTTYPVAESEVYLFESIPFLAIARSLGDFWSLNINTGLYVVSPEPDVSCVPIDPRDRAIVLATDGLWNVIGSDSAVRMLQEIEFLKGKNRNDFPDHYFMLDNFYDVGGPDDQNYAKSLVYLAYQSWARRSLRSDNITVVVALLEDLFHNPDPIDPRRCWLRGLKIEGGPRLKQIQDTRSYWEHFRFANRPSLSPPREKEILNRLDIWLTLPPTLITFPDKDDDYDEHPELIYPRNYGRLSGATYKILKDGSNPDTLIYIKHVSDDPADKILQPSRLNKSGKEVRDSSAMAVQTIYDFGQPWHQLIGREISDSEISTSSDEEPCEQVEEPDFYSFDNEEENKRRKSDDTDTMNQLKCDNWRSSRSRREKSTPQLRCLMNCQRPVTRSSSIDCSAGHSERRTRSSYTELKRKRLITQAEQCN